MKLSPRDAPGYFAKPDPESAGLLLYGPDVMRIALRRQEVIKALIGPSGEEEMRLARIPAAELRKDPAQALDALKAVGFFPGPRVVFIEDATDQTAPPILSALEDWQAGDAQLVVTAGQLRATSKLRKAFESHGRAYAAGIYDDPPGREEIERTLTEAGLRASDREVMNALTDLARTLDPGDFRQTMQKLGLYKLGDETPIGPDDIAACAPASTEADLDDILHVVAEARAPDIGPLLRRLQAQGANPVSLAIAATRHFRVLHAAASDPEGAARGIARAKPPAAKLEIALGVLMDTDLTLRSAAQTAPQMALVERAFIRLAMLGADR
jgi:DNA polymerase-3 subunit delta